MRGGKKRKKKNEIHAETRMNPPRNMYAITHSMTEEQEEREEEELWDINLSNSRHDTQSDMAPAFPTYTYINVHIYTRWQWENKSQD